MYSIGDNAGEELVSATSIVTLVSYVNSSTREKMERYELDEEKENIRHL